MSLEKVTEVFETANVSVEVDEEDDEDVEALMAELYDETQNTKQWCKFQAGSIEDEAAPIEEDNAEEEYVEDVADYDQGGLPVAPASRHDPSVQGENFLGFLEQSAAGKHENFKGHDAPTPKWTDELRRTAEVAAANVDALTGSVSDWGSAFSGSGSKKADAHIQSASRFLAYAVMLASVITLCAKASITREDAAADAVAAAVASRSVSELKHQNEDLKMPIDQSKTVDQSKSVDQLFNTIDKEVETDKQEKKRSLIAEKMHQKHMAELEKKETAERENEDLQEKKRDEQEAAERRDSFKQEQDDIKRVLEVAKSLERREQEEGGSIDPEAAKIIEAAKSLAAKALSKENKRAQTENELDHQVQDHLRNQEVAAQAKKDAMNALQDSHKDSSKHQAHVEKSVHDTAWLMGNKDSDPNAGKAQEDNALGDDKDAENKAQESNRMLLEKAKDKIKKHAWEQEQQKKLSDVAPDTNAECGPWAGAGECANNAVWMRENCATSCAQHLLRDKDHRCSAWADVGECEKNQNYMRHHCPESCGMNAPAPAPAAPTQDFARAKRAAKLKKKMKAQEVKDSSKSYIVRGKGLQKAADEVLEETDAMNWHGRVPHDRWKSAEDSLLDRLSNIPDASVEHSSHTAWLR